MLGQQDSATGEARARAAQHRSAARLPGPVGEVDGVLVDAFGGTFVYGVSPTFAPEAQVQRHAASEQVKIRPKRSWDLAENRLGSMVSWQPRTPRNDIQPFLSVHLIDGDPNTCWCSRGEGQADAEPAWIRIDLAREETVSEIILVPRPDRKGFPAELKVMISRDAWHWDTVYDPAEREPPAGDDPMRIRLQPVARAKQLWIIGRGFPLINELREHCFSLAGVRVLNEEGSDRALLSRGAGVTVSSTNYGEGSRWDVYDQLWPIQYDLGVKWIRLSGSNWPYHHDTLQWRFVEREKGKYDIDEKTDQAITEATANGCRVIVILSYGNWLYTSQPDKESFDVRRFPTPFPPGPVTREAFEGFKSWVRFMVGHFKGRVAFWEIYNEPIGFGWEVLKDYQERVRIYCDLVKEVVPLIREADPEARISLAGMAGVPGITQPPWLHDCLKHDVVRLVDAIGWHTQGTVHPEYPENWRVYPDQVRSFQREAEAWGFSGEWMVSEAWWGAPYPPHSQWGHPPHRPVPGKRLTELRKAKDMARHFMVNQGLGVISFWCNTWFDQGQNDGGMFRNGFAGDPPGSTQPQAAYYVMRTLCTVMAGAQPAELPVSFPGAPPELESYQFTLPDGKLLVGMWLAGESVDRHPGIEIDARIEGVVPSRVVAVDTLNGCEQELHSHPDDGAVLVPGLVVRDYPLLVRLDSGNG